ncbi:MAG: hypothetical protein NUV91_08830, partial [Candidatus Omnitrophica bacterium]|nr:hypothetical protein [Candidatus Omnitrophota bacterium]
MTKSIMSVGVVCLHFKKISRRALALMLVPVFIFSGIDDQTWAQNQFVQVPVGDRLESYVVLGGESVAIGQSVIISGGNVGVNNTVLGAG